MAGRKFFIGQCLASDGKTTLYVLLEEVGGVLTEPKGKLLAEIWGGEKKFKPICQALLKVKKAQKKAAPKVATTAFTVSNLVTDTMLVETDSSLSLIYPLSGKKMDKFYIAFFKEGNYQ